MGLFNTTRNIYAMSQDISMVRNSRKDIFTIRDRLRGTSLFSNIFYTLIGDINHPPRIIEGNQMGCFWSEGFDASVNNYEPFATQKLNNPNIGYTEGCAIFLLIQECFPNVYDFPSNTTAAIQNGATIKLIMKKSFIGKTLNPAVVPPVATPQPAAVQNTTHAQAVYQVHPQSVEAQNAYVPPIHQAPTPQPASTTPSDEFKFCSACGYKTTVSANFCTKCGNKLN